MVSRLPAKNSKDGITWHPPLAASHYLTIFRTAEYLYLCFRCTMSGAASFITLLLCLAFLAFACATDKVDVVLYGEALCPYTIAAIKKTVGPLTDGPLAAHFTFRYTAYGNAKRFDGVLKCQHGPAECRVNRIINCAQKLYPDQGQWLPFVRCLAFWRPGEVEGAVARCARDSGLDLDNLQGCATGEQGEALEKQAEEETGALHPAHTYVPWLVVNGVPLGEDDDNLYKYICVAIGKGDKPEKCFAPPDLKLKLGSRRDWEDLHAPAAANSK